MQIKDRQTGAVMFEVAVATIRECVGEAARQNANLRGSNLSGSDLRYSNLRHSNLSYSNLRYSDLRHSNLRDSNLRHSNLRHSNLSDSDLSHSNLSYSDLSGSNLSDSDLSHSNLSYSDLHDITVNWNSHELLAEILRQKAGENTAKRKIAGLVLVSHDWCWDKFLRLRDPTKLWALGVLRRYVKEGDGAPEILRKQKW